MRGINVKALVDTDLGRWVWYYPGIGPRQRGRIKAWNETWIFVVYHCDENWDRYREYTSAGTDPNELEFIEEHEMKGAKDNEAKPSTD